MRGIYRASRWELVNNQSIPEAENCGRTRTFLRRIAIEQTHSLYCVRVSPQPQARQTVVEKPLSCLEPHYVPVPSPSDILFVESSQAVNSAASRSTAAYGW